MDTGNRQPGAPMAEQSRPAAQMAMRDPEPSSSNSALRVSDAERETAARHLSDALSVGRLGLDEYDQRLTDAMNARTRGELRPITADLPVDQDETHGSHSPAPPSTGTTRRTSSAQWPYLLAGGGFFAGVWIIPGLVTGNLNVLWGLLPVVLVWGVAYVANRRIRDRHE